MTTGPGRKENSLYTVEIPWLPEEEVEKILDYQQADSVRGKLRFIRDGGCLTATH